MEDHLSLIGLEPEQASHTKLNQLKEKQVDILIRASRQARANARQVVSTAQAKYGAGEDPKFPDHIEGSPLGGPDDARSQVALEGLPWQYGTERSFLKSLPSSSTKRQHEMYPSRARPTVCNMQGRETCFCARLVAAAMSCCVAALCLLCTHV